MDNKWWNHAQSLARLCQASYFDQDDVESALGTDGYTEIIIKTIGDLRFFVADGPDRIVVAFRGTVNLGNWLSNINIAGTRPTSLGDVHPGFFDAANTLQEDWEDVVKEMDPEEKKPVWLAGHSLGGALAVIAAAEFPDPDRIEGIFTFGMPRTGRAEFQKAFEERFAGRAFRFVNHGDPIPSLPLLRMGYFHAGQPVLLEPDGVVYAEPDSVRGGPAGNDEFTEKDVAEIERTFRQLEGGTRSAGAEERTLREEVELEPVRGQLPGVRNHLMNRYVVEIIQAIMEGKPPPETAGSRRGSRSPESPEETRPNGAGLPSPELPPFAVHVLWSRQSSEQGTLCPGTAAEIFERLSHSPGLEPGVEHGAGIPVYVGHHFDTVRDMLQRPPSLETDPAMVVVLLIDNTSEYDVVFTDFVEWIYGEEGREARFWPRAIVIPVLLESKALSLPGLPSGASAIDVRREEKDQRIESAVWEVGTEVAHYLIDLQENHEARRSRQEKIEPEVCIFVSYSRGDAKKNSNFAENFSRNAGNRIRTFFDVRDFQRGGRTPLDQQIQQLQKRAVTLVIKSDSYSTSPYCQDEMLNAKQAGMPIVTLQMLSHDGRGRTFPYEANTITLIGESPGEDDESMMRRCAWTCLRAWLHHLHFHRVARVVFARRGVGLPPKYLSRHPELLDFVEAPLGNARSGLVLYPDPPLGTRESELIRRAHPRVRLTTPTTFSKETMQRNPAPPLDGMRVAFSLSDSTELGKDFAELDGDTRGLAMDHLNGIAEYLTLALVRAGAELGYGGRFGSENYTSMLADLVSGHKRVQKQNDHLLFVYRSHHDVKPAGDQSDAEDKASIINVEGCTEPGKKPEFYQMALNFSLMRLWMAQDQSRGRKSDRSCDARIVAGGKTKGYLGRFPGQAEETWQHLVAGKPVYIIGGFYGSSRQVARALCGQIDDLPGEADMEREDPNYASLRKDYDDHRPDKLKNLPEKLEDLWKDFADWGKGNFWGEGAGDDQLWRIEGSIVNGLTVAENRRLFVSDQYDEISSLVIKGLCEYRSRQDGKRPLTVALYRGSIVDVLDVQGYAVLILGSARLRGADIALDTKLNGEIRKTLERRNEIFDRIIPVDSDQLSGDFVIPYWIEDLGEMSRAPEEATKWLSETLQSGLEKIAKKCAGNKIRSLAIVPMGANLGLTVEESVGLILDVFQNPKWTGNLRTLAICEIDPARYEEVEAFVRKRSSGEEDFPVVELPSQPVNPGSISPMFLQFQGKATPEDDLESSRITQIVRGPGGTASVPVIDKNVIWSQLEDTFSRWGKNAPPFGEHIRLGKELVDWFLEEDQIKPALLEEGLSRPWDILHDPVCSAVPFEMMRIGERFPALEQGIRRGLLVDELPYFAPPSRRAIYHALLVVNPTSDLPGAEREGKQVQAILEKAFGHKHALPRMEIKLLKKTTATRTNVLREVATGKYEFIHYAGHGLFDPDDIGRCGLLLCDGLLTADRLQGALARIGTVKKMADEESPHPPTLVLLNACLSSRFMPARRRPTMKERGEFNTTLAQAILLSGVGGFIGNRWAVRDEAAKDFAVRVFTDLVNRNTLGNALLKGRRILFDRQSRDWCNYVFYGAPDIRL